MDTFIELLRNLINPNWILSHGGIWLVLLIIFAETGLFLGCFLPGDSLLFVVGMGLSRGEGIELFEGVQANVVVVMLMMVVAGILGNSMGYWFGKKSGSLLYQKKDNFFYKKQYLEQARLFYEKNGSVTILIARFLPIIRTFAPIVAGIVNMRRYTFLLFNVIGCLAWIFSIVLAGYFLGQRFPILHKRLDLIIIGIILITTLPVFYKIVKHRLNNYKKKALKE